MPKVDPLIEVVVNGEKKRLAAAEFESFFSIRFAPYLDFQDLSIKQSISKQIAKLHKRGELTYRQLWQGVYYRKEIESLCLPDITLAWIDSSVGWGVFANRAFKKGDYLGEYCGVVRKRVRSDKKNAYCFEYLFSEENPTPYVIDARDQGGIVRFINHSNAPNVLTDLATFDDMTHVILVASQPIAKGDQILYDYGPDYWSCRSAPKKLHPQ